VAWGFPLFSFGSPDERSDIRVFVRESRYRFAHPGYGLAQTSSKLRNLKRSAAAVRCPGMEPPHKQWKRDADRLWSASPFEFRQAAAVTAEIARHGADETLRQAAAQALPSLRGASLKTSHQMSRNVARRRFGAIRDALHALDAPRFGKRAAVPASEHEHRRLLGLPAERQLSDPEIQQGYKRAAKHLHPDAGGSAREFTELSAARDALMKRK
jgi:hypothetical protein